MEVLRALLPNLCLCPRTAFGSYDPKQGVFAIQIAGRGDASIDREKGRRVITGWL